MEIWYEIVVDKGYETEGIYSCKTKDEAIRIMQSFQRFISGKLFVAREVNNG